MVATVAPFVSACIESSRGFLIKMYYFLVAYSASIVTYICILVHARSHQCTVLVRSLVAPSLSAWSVHCTLVPFYSRTIDILRTQIFAMSLLVYFLSSVRFYVVVLVITARPCTKLDEVNPSRLQFRRRRGGWVCRFGCRCCARST